MSPDLENLTSSANIITNNDFEANAGLTNWTTSNTTNLHLGAGGDGYSFKTNIGTSGEVSFDLSAILAAGDIGKTYFASIELRCISSTSTTPISIIIQNTSGSTYNTAAYHDLGYPSHTASIGAGSLETYYVALRYLPAGGTPKFVIKIGADTHVYIRSVTLQPLGGSPAIPCKSVLESNFTAKDCPYESKYALKLDGVKQYGYHFAPNHAFQNYITNADRAGTLSFWVNLSSKALGYNPIFHVGDITAVGGHAFTCGFLYINATHGYILIVRMNDIPNGGHIDQQFGPFKSAMGVTLQNDWHHFTITYDGNGASVANNVGTYQFANGIHAFHNGVKITEHHGSCDDDYVSMGAPTPVNTPWTQTIGASFINGNTHYTPGSLDDMAMWKAVLTPDEIAAIYNGGKGLNLTLPNISTTYPSATVDNLIKYWTFEDAWHWTYGGYAPNSPQPNMIYTGGFIPDDELLAGPMYLFSKLMLIEGATADTNTPF